MEITSYDSIMERARTLKKRGVAAVAGAADRHVIEATLEARELGVAEPLFIGDAAKIKGILREMGLNPSEFRVEGQLPGMNAPETAVEIIKAGEADFIMKGMVETSDLMRPVVKKENDLRTGRNMSHLSFNILPAYHKLIVLTDGGMTPYPDLAKKKDIVANVVNTLHTLGYESPKVACLCCKETVDEKMPETTDARALQEMSLAGEFGACEVVGPVSFDIAFSKEIAQIKGFEGPHCGNFDVVLVPNIHAGNILGKCWVVWGKSTMTGFVVGAKIPIVLTSRGSSAQEKYLALALSSVVTGAFN
ncbi:MAG: phosphate butyryltransferase [Lachnospiraceae bacterium]|nr:phosphate butyryltransferase [Lachnospiraceae bacterium]